MAIFKVVQTGGGGVAGYATTQKVENYLKYELDEDGNPLVSEDGKSVQRAAFVSAQNANADSFSDDCSALAGLFATNDRYDCLKYKHYVQGFAVADSELMSKEQCHALGVELAKTLWSDFPVLVVTHTDRLSDGSEKCHWHNHFIVYNCSTSGKKLSDNRRTLWSQKRYVAAQADAHGLTRAGLILSLGKIREGQAAKNETIGEKKLASRLKKQGEATKKAELRLAVKRAMTSCNSYNEFREFLLDTYGVRTKEKNGELLYSHPESTVGRGEWLKATSLGEYATKEAIESGFNEFENGRNDFRGSIERGSERNADRRVVSVEERFERIRRLYDEIFAATPSVDGTSSGIIGADDDTMRATEHDAEYDDGRGEDIGCGKRKSTKNSYRKNSNGGGQRF